MTGIDISSESATYAGRAAHLRTVMEERGLDAIVVSDVGAPPQPPYARHVSGLHIPQRIAPVNHAVVVPVNGEPTLVVPPGIRRSFFELARARSWISNVVCADYIDDRDFPPAEGSGVIVFSAPDERRLRELLHKADRVIFRADGATPLPLEGRKLHWQIGE